MSQWTSSFSLIGATGPTGATGPLLPATDYGSYLYYNTSNWVVGSTSVSLGTDAGLTNQGSNSVAIGYKAGETNQPVGSIILNAGVTGLNGNNAGFYIKPVREDTLNYQRGLFYNTNDYEVIHNSIITLSSPNTVIIAGNIVPDKSITYSLGTSSLRYADLFVGPGTINIAGPSNANATIGTDVQGTVYTESGFAAPFVNVGPAQLTPAAIGGWRMGPTGIQGSSNYDLVAQEIQANGSGPTGPAFSLVKPKPFLGNVITLDSVYGDDTTAAPGQLPYKTFSAAAAALQSGYTMNILPGTYSVSSPLTLPSNCSITGLSLQTCKIQMTTSSATTMITMGENTRIEHLTILLTGTADVDLTGVAFPGSTSQTAKIRTCILKVDNSAVNSTTCNVTGIYVNSVNTTDESTFSFNFLSGSLVQVFSKSTGRVRGLLCVNGSISSTRDTNIYVSSLNLSANNCIGIETLSTASLQLRTTAVGGTHADISQTGGTIQIGPGCDLVNRNANGKSFTTSVYPTSIFYGLKGDFTNLTSNNGWLWPGSLGIQKASGGAPAYPDTAIAYFRMAQPAILYGMMADVGNPTGANNSTILVTYISTNGYSVATPSQFILGYSDSEVGMKSFNSASISLKKNDTIAVYLSTSGALNSNTMHDLTVQLELF